MDYQGELPATIRTALDEANSSLQKSNAESDKQVNVMVDRDRDIAARFGREAWQGSALYLWDGAMIHRLAPIRLAGFQWQMNAVGQVVWQASDGKDLEIYLWDGAAVRQTLYYTLHELGAARMDAARLTRLQRPGLLTAADEARPAASQTRISMWQTRPCSLVRMLKVAVWRSGSSNPSSRTS